MTRASGLLALLAILPLSGGRTAQAEPGDGGRAWSQPTITVRTIPRKTRDKIREAMGSKFLGSSDDEKRADGRQMLIDLGEIAASPLMKAVTGNGKSRLRMNAAIALAAIGSPRGADAFREALARGGDSGFVLVVPALGLGLFGRSQDHEVLVDVSKRKGKWSAVAATLALAKLPGSDPADRIRDRLTNMPRRDTHDAATWLAAALLLPDAELERVIDHKDAIVRHAAALALCVRPRNEGRAKLMKALGRAKENEFVRAAQVHALARLPRDEEIRERLLKIANPSEKRDSARQAALLALAEERGHSQWFGDFRKWHRTTRSNEAVQGELLLAILRTDHLEAAEYVFKFVESNKRFSYVGLGALLVELARMPDRKHANGLLEKMADLRGTWKDLDSDDPRRLLMNAAADVRDLEASRDRVQAARAAIVNPKGPDRDRVDPDERALDLWWRTPDQRAFVLLNRFLPRLFKLDQLVNRADPSRNSPTGPGGTVKQKEIGDDMGDARKAVTANPDEQDLNAFLTSRPYFARRDRRRADR